MGSRTIKGWSLVHFYVKEKQAIQRGVSTERILVSILIQLDAGYPLFVKGSHKPSGKSIGTKGPDGDTDQTCPVEIPLEIGSVLLWYAKTELVYPIVSRFEHGGGFAILLGYNY